MILTNTKNTGYSLGLPLWMPSGVVSTGCLQGINMTLRGVYTAVYLSRYRRNGQKISMTFSTDNGILCSMSGTLDGAPHTFELTNESDNSQFVCGSVTLYDVGGSLEIDLTGAQVCPKYIQFIQTSSAAAPVLEIIDTAENSDTTTSVLWSTLTPTPAYGVDLSSGTSGGSIYYVAKNTEDTDPLITVGDSAAIYYINGSAVSSTGVFELTLGSSWVVSGNNICAKVGLLTDAYSCPDGNYIEAKLKPGNHTQACPFDIAFSGGKLVIDQVYNTRFNTEYENCVCSGGTVVSGACIGGTTVCSGLAWNEFSRQHDI